MTKTLIYAVNEVGLETDVEKTMYMLLPCHYTAGESRDVNLATRAFKNVP
jgi:hypothetical protein